MNLTECQTIDQILGWSLTESHKDGRSYNGPKESQMLHQAALIGARLGIEAAAKTVDGYTTIMGPKDTMDVCNDLIKLTLEAIRALNPTEIIKKGM